MVKPAQIARHLAATVVPFREDQSIDEAEFRRVCRHVFGIEAIDGLAVNAHAGEVDLLSTEERVRIVEIACEEAHPRGRKVVSGVVPFPGSTAGAVAQAKAMQAAGADGLLLLGPSSFGRGVEFAPEVAEAYTREVARSVQIPIIYFISGVLSGINHTPEVVRRICSVEGVVSAKDTMWSPIGFDINLRIYRSLNKRFDVLTGNDNCVFYNFVAGADGSLLILNCVIGPQITRMFDLIQQGRIIEARDIHQKHETLVSLLFEKPMLRMPTRHKYILRHLGVISSVRTRAPIPDLAPGEAEKILAEVDRLELHSGLNDCAA